MKRKLILLLVLLTAIFILIDVFSKIDSQHQEQITLTNTIGKAIKKTPMPTIRHTSDTTPAPYRITPEGTSIGNDDAILKIQELLLSEGKCDLPCFIGITPGVSTSQETADLLWSIDSISTFRNFYSTSGISTLQITDGEHSLHIKFAYVADSAKNYAIERLDVRIREFKNKDYYYERSFFSKIIYPYTLVGVLTDLGKPESVQISTHSINTDQSWQFLILLLYPEDGVLVQYTIPLQMNGQMIEGCPANAFIDLELMPVGNSM